MITSRDEIRQARRRAIALVLAGGRGSRLQHLTDRRAKPAVYFGGKFRIIDFALSNCINSGIRRIGVITQYKSHSLLRHLQRGWAFLQSEMNEFVDLLPAQQRVDEEQLVPRHGRRGLPEPGHPARLRRRLRGRARRRPRLQDELRADARPTTSPRARRARSAASRCRATEATAFGVMARRRATTGSSTSSRSRPTRRPSPASPTARWPAWASTSSTPTYLYRRAASATCADAELQPRLRQGHHPARGAQGRRRWRTRST